MLFYFRHHDPGTDNPDSAVYLYSRMHILNTSFSLILPQVGFALPLSVMLFVSFYSFIPNELIESAIVDGCSPYRTFISIVFPLAKTR